MHLVYPLALGAVLFSIGMYGVLARRNAVLVLMSIEIMLNAVNINFVAFNAYLQDTLLQGQIFALFVITVAAAEVGVGLAIVLLIFRNRETIAIDDMQELGDSAPARRPVRVTPGPERTLERRG
jgi:NADH-quinone oxidoreductase subunit K